MLREQQGEEGALASVNLQLNSSSSGIGLVSDTDMKSTRMVELLGKIFVCTFLRVEGAEAQLAASPSWRSAVMQRGSQLRSICKPPTWPLLPDIRKITSVDTGAGLDAASPRSPQRHRTATARAPKVRCLAECAIISNSSP